jgi:proteic killer suppression protein
MIESFKHKGLKKYFETGDSSKLNQAHIRRLRLILTQLHATQNISDMNFPGSNLHKLSGDKEDFWSVSVSGNWRAILGSVDGDAYDVDYLDYH